MAISMLAGAAGGLITAAGSLVGGRARRKREAAAKAEYDMQLQNLKDFNFENYYAGMENVYEDMTINQDAARFQSELRDARLAQQQQNLLQAGLGGAATAQALLGATVTASRQDAADIAKQEQAIQAAQLQEQSRSNRCTRCRISKIFTTTATCKYFRNRITISKRCKSRGNQTIIWWFRNGI